jgi:hypothetical protein
VDQCVWSGGQAKQQLLRKNTGSGKKIHSHFQIQLFRLLISLPSRAKTQFHLLHVACYWIVALRPVGEEGGATEPNL